MSHSSPLCSSICVLTPAMQLSSPRRSLSRLGVACVQATQGPSGLVLTPAHTLAPSTSRLQVWPRDLRFPKGERIESQDPGRASSLLLFLDGGSSVAGSPATLVGRFPPSQSPLLKPRCRQNPGLAHHPRPQLCCVVLLRSLVGCQVVWFRDVPSFSSVPSFSGSSLPFPSQIAALRSGRDSEGRLVQPLLSFCLSPSLFS